MRLKTLQNDPNPEEDALRYPEFLLKVVDGTVPGTRDGPDQMNIPKLVKLVK